MLRLVYSANLIYKSAHLISRHKMIGWAKAEFLYGYMVRIPAVKFLKLSDSFKWYILLIKNNRVRNFDILLQAVANVM